MVHSLALALALSSGCSLLFDESLSVDKDASPSQGDAMQGNFDDFENGLGNWQILSNSENSCALQADPKDENNQVVCCNSSALQGNYAVILRNLERNQSVDMTFKLYIQTPPSGEPGSAFSPLAGLQASPDPTVIRLANMNTFSDSSFSVASVPGAGTSGSSPTMPFAKDEWLNVRFGAETQGTCKEASTTVGSDSFAPETATIEFSNNMLSDFSYATLGAFRQNPVANMSARCFDDVEILYQHQCSN